MITSFSHFNSKTSFLSKSKPKSNLSRSSSRYMPTVIAMLPKQSYWTSIESDIEIYLKKAIRIRSPESVFEPMHHLTFAAPRTTAPALCVAACEFIGGDRSQAMAAASAIHLIHAAAYTHENLPLTDRLRPKPAIQHKYGPNIELLTGDAIIPFGLEMLAKSKDLAPNNQDKILRVIIEITRATGARGMVDGLYQELVFHKLGIDSEIFEYVCQKRGELHACGAACGAILGGGAEVEIEKLRNFGLYIGMIQGLQLRRKTNGMEDKLDKLNALALKELEFLRGKKTELISSLVEPSPCAAQI